MTTTTTDVLVIGAGPTGLTMANLLARYGVRVKILDKKVGPTKESRAVVVHAKTLELLDKLGFTEKALEDGERLSSVHLLSRGKRAGMLSFLNSTMGKDTPYPFALIYGQDQTEHHLLQSLEEVGIRVEWSIEFLRFEQTPDGTHALVRTSDGSEETIEAQWVIAADGSHSLVRHALSLGFAGETYAQTLFVADLDMQWKLGSQQGGIDLERKDFFLFIPMRDENRFRLFGTLPPDLANRDTLTLDDVRHVIDTQSSLHVDILKARWISVYRTHHRIAERFRVGRAFLVGDAAHIHSPAGGQGMNTGIGDAYNLAWKLALVIKGHAHETLLDSYEAERIPFARSILKSSDLAFQLMTTNNRIAPWLKLFVVPQLFRLVSPLPFFRRRAFWFISQLWTTYRNNPSIAQSESRRQGPQAGDRAPYGFFEAGQDAGKSIFTKLKDLDHHIFLFEGIQTTQSHVDIPTLEKNVQALLNLYTIPIHLHSITAENRGLHKLYSVDTPTLFLVRPDGHIAYCGSAEDITTLRIYLDKGFVKSDIPIHALEAHRLT